ncbi:ATP-dependent DNA helicase RecG [Petrocella sp. FN5]|uniref:ATP-dependent DNA helicase RecG n=1 Tax=Petrocella sp. FN5 TaxID=3032002 RepID=UPI0023DAE037|nr:ATP-dependent DNA helicase RecG [Petrocella sp. FN5]MDF1616405.1 ATP-dependent DNA helicase RecG [Petrocella sp. FN5]
METNKPITELSGIGKKKAQLFEKIGIKSLMDLVTYYPTTYEKGIGYSRIQEVKPNGTYLIQGEIMVAPYSKKARQVILTSTRIKDDTGEIGLTWFNQPYLQKQLKEGQMITVMGKASYKYEKLQLTSPKILTQADLNYYDDKTIIPIYPLTKGINQKAIRLAVASAMEAINNRIEDYLPDMIREANELISLEDAIYQVHYPQNDVVLNDARRRLVFDEFLFFQLGLMMLKDEQVRIENQYNFECRKGYENTLKKLPFALTSAQYNVLDEIIKDMNGSYNMNRLIQGDVGSGKTVVAALAIILAAENGYQSVLMAPTEVLAKQHLQSLEKMFVSIDLRIELLVGSMTKKEKVDTYQKIEAGLIDVVLGTHAVIQEGVNFKNLALVITDEQHRFGVAQRELLAGKGHYPHVLVMSGTPIPRTLGLILYGDMDVSIIDELPPGRKSIETFVVNDSYRNRVKAFIAKEIEAGRQCYIVCPMVEENEENDLKDVLSYTEKLKVELPPHIRIEYLHGQMRPKEKNETMERFARGELDILVSTTVIEVGINVPNATLMIIEDAHRFGLAQLHQLRGRVGRGGNQSYCILISDSQSVLGKKRMAIMTESQDGFYIAQKDLEIRGHGDLLGLRQSGMPTFKIANIVEDMEILKQAHLVAKTISEKRDILQEATYENFRKKLENYMETNMSFIAL